MMDLADYAAAVVEVAGDQVMDKARLQKIAYLLEAMGLGNGLDFDYHRFGPFSAELAFAVDDAEAFGYLEPKEERGYHKILYTSFRSRPGAPKFDVENKRKERREAAKTMGGHSAFVLEIAASVVYFGRTGYADSAWDEVRKRKGVVASERRLNAARELVENLQLEPQSLIPSNRLCGRSAVSDMLSA